MQNTTCVRNQHCLVSRLREYGISNAIIYIVQTQRITDDDIRIMDRNDIDHLFKVEDGFTFTERKHFWQFVQELQSSSAMTDTVHQVLHVQLDVDSPELLEQIFEFDEEKGVSLSSIQRCASSSSSNVHLSNTNQTYELHDGDESEHKTISSIILPEAIENHRHQRPSSSEFVFRHPTPLPIFSFRVTFILRKDATTARQRVPLMRELAEWALSMRPSIRYGYEFEAICQTLYEKYPNLGTAGRSPWFELSKTLAFHVRMRRRRQKAKEDKLNEKISEKNNEHIHNILSDIVTVD